MAADTPTPRTDAVAFAGHTVSRFARDHLQLTQETQYVEANFARILERKLAQAEAALEKAREVALAHLRSELQVDENGDDVSGAEPSTLWESGYCAGIRHAYRTLKGDQINALSGGAAGTTTLYSESKSALRGAQPASAPAPAAPICSECKGAGTVVAQTTHLGPDDYTYDAECPSCGGAGVATAPAAPLAQELAYVAEFLREGGSHRESDICTRAAAALEAALSATDAKDAARYRFIRNKTGADKHGFQLPYPELKVATHDVNLLKGSVAEHIDVAIDRCIAAIDDTGAGK